MSNLLSFLLIYSQCLSLSQMPLGFILETTAML